MSKLFEKKKDLFFATGFVWIFLFAFLSPCPAQADPFAQLKQSLISDGYSKEAIEALFGENGAQFDLSSATGYFRHRESALNYDQFLSEQSIAAARAYRARHMETLRAAQARFGVDPEIIVAILLVETRLGTFPGNRSVLSTLATLASLSHEPNVLRLWEEVNARYRTERAAVESWSERRSGWAYRELKNFLDFTRKQGVDPLGVVGSYAGALGFGQFLPSSAMSHAVDGDGDGVIDLFSHADAIFSIASYLKNHGWEPVMTKPRLREVLFTYNRSRPYANTLIAIRTRLKEAP
ncbi:MAG: lytic murein transglycosylase [Desulfatibacillaceae bacterium]|nr:lytic murein transglycosylase [Desulfatibacillaceae bacterium]